MGSFWLRIFDNIGHFIRADQGSRSKNHFKSRVLLNIMRGLFDGTVHYANTRKQTLINGGTITCCHEIQRYLLALHGSLKVDQWITAEQSSIAQQHYAQISSFIMTKLRVQLHFVTNAVNNAAHGCPMPPVLPDIPPLPRLPMDMGMDMASKRESVAPTPSLYTPCTSNKAPAHYKWDLEYHPQLPTMLPRQAPTMLPPQQSFKLSLPLPPSLAPTQRHWNPPQTQTVPPNISYLSNAFNVCNCSNFNNFV